MSTLSTALDAAASLHSEQGENPEYDRALVELIADTFGPELRDMGAVKAGDDGDTIKASVNFLIQQRRVYASPFDDIEPTSPRDPFAKGALLPNEVRTRHSTYTIRHHAVRVGQSPTVTVTAETGTFGGRHWTVPTNQVRVTRAGFYVGRDVNGDDVDLRTTAPTHIDGLPVETWPR